MSELTLQQLLSCDPTPFTEAAMAWQECAEQIDKTEPFSSWVAGVLDGLQDEDGLHDRGRAAWATP